MPVKECRVIDGRLEVVYSLTEDFVVCFKSCYGLKRWSNKKFSEFVKKHVYTGRVNKSLQDIEIAVSRIHSEE